MKPFISILLFFMLINIAYAKKFTIDFLPKLSEKSTKSQVEQMLKQDSIQYEWKNNDYGSKYILIYNPKYTIWDLKISQLKIAFEKNKCMGIVLLLDNSISSQTIYDKLDKISNCRYLKEDKSGNYFYFDNTFIIVPYDLNDDITIMFKKFKCN